MYRIDCDYKWIGTWIWNNKDYVFVSSIRGDNLGVSQNRYDNLISYFQYLSNTREWKIIFQNFDVRESIVLQLSWSYLLMPTYCTEGFLEPLKICCKGQFFINIIYGSHYLFQTLNLTKIMMGGGGQKGKMCT